jgi:Ca-activated chloride channel family protein
MMSSSGSPSEPNMVILQQIDGTRTKAIVPLLVGLLASGTAVYGQFTSGVNLVEVYATVTDRDGSPVTGLRASDFAVSEDGVPQQITAFAAGQFPLSVAIGLDRSFSMGGKTDRLSVARSAARTFVDALEPDDQVMVLAIGGDTTIASPLSTDHRAALTAIDRLDAWGTTPLYDATRTALDAIQPATGRRALVLLSDGTDRYSETNAADLVEDARKRDVMVYPIAIGSTRPPVFAELAAATGGRSFFAKDPRDLPVIMTTIARELRLQYLLGYVPARIAGRGWHAIDVRVERAGARVRARDGYYVR